MFGIRFKSRDGTEKELVELLQSECKELQIHKFAIEKSINMITKAIARSRILIHTKQNSVENRHIAYRLNVQPNDNESAYDFWSNVVRRLILYEECLVCCIKGQEGCKFYIVDTCEVNDLVMKPRRYSNIQIIVRGDIKRLNRTFSEEEMLVFRYKNRKIQNYLDSVVKIYDQIENAMAASKKIAAAPKFKIMLDAHAKLVEAPETKDGRPRELTGAQYKERVKQMLEADALALFTKSQGIDLEQLKVDTNVSAEDLVKMGNSIFDMASMAFDIPKTVYYGTITEKSDATNEFITFATSPIVKVMEDTFNAKIVGESDFVKGEHISIDFRAFKHRDVVDVASGLNYLRGIGFSFDEIREMVGYEPLHTDFSEKRALTKNYSDEEKGEEDEKKGF